MEPAATSTMLAGPFDRVARRVVFVLEMGMLAILGGLVVFAIAGLVMQLLAVVTPPFLGADQLTVVLDDVLAVFVLIELLATALAYLRGTDVLRRIFEAVFVAIARKLITFDLAAGGLPKAAAIATLLVAAAGAWWLIARSERPPD